MSTNNHGTLTKIPKVIEQPSLKTLSKQISTKIVSKTPGRLRLRIARKHRQPEEMQRIANVLEAHPNVTQVRTNMSQGSIVINHDDKDDSWENLVGTLLDLGIIFGDIAEGKSDVAMDVSGAVVDLNKRVEQATNGAVDLRLLFPFGLSILAVRQLMKQGLRIDIIPWYVLAWYAFDSFIKLHGIHQAQSNNE